MDNGIRQTDHPMPKSAEASLQELEKQKQHVTELMKRVSSSVLNSRLKRARLRQGLSVRELAVKAQLSKTSIVRLEQGNPSHPMTVVKICEALGLHLAGITDPATLKLAPVAVHHHQDDRWYDMTDFGAGPLGEHDRPLRPTERTRFARKSGVIPLLYLRSRLEAGKLLPVVIELHQASPMRSHAGEEFVYVLQGSLQIRIAGKDYLLEEGESITFWSAEEHLYSPSPQCKSLPVRILSIRIDEPARQESSR